MDGDLQRDPVRLGEHVLDLEPRVREGGEPRRIQIPYPSDAFLDWT